MNILNTIFNVLKAIFNTILLLLELLLFWIIICALIVFISIFFNISIDTSKQIVLATIFILNGIFFLPIINEVFKDIKVHKIFYITCAYIIPICSILLGLSLIINLLGY